MGFIIVIYQGVIGKQKPKSKACLTVGKGFRRLPSLRGQVGIPEKPHLAGVTRYARDTSEV